MMLRSVLFAVAMGIVLSGLLISRSLVVGAELAAQMPAENDAFSARDATYPKTPFLRIEVEQQHGATVTSADLDRSGHLLVTGSFDKTVRVWSLPDKSHNDLLLLNVLRPPIAEGPTGKIYAVSISPDGKLVAAGGYTGFAGKEMSVFIFEPASGQILKRIGVPTTVVSLAFSPDGQHLVAGLHHGKGIRVWRVTDWRQEPADGEYHDGVFGLAFDRDGRLATTSFDGRIRLYDAQFNQTASFVTAPVGKKPYGIAFSPDAKQMAVGYADTAAVTLLEVEATKLQLSGMLQPVGPATRSLASVAWSQDGQFVYAAGQYQKGELFVVRRWDRANKNSVRDLTALGNTNFVQALRPYGASGVLVATSDPSIGAYDPEDQLLFKRGPALHDMRLSDDGSDKDEFRVSRDGSVIQFRGRRSGRIRFDLTARSLVPADQGEQLEATHYSSDALDIPFDDFHGIRQPKIRRRDGSEFRPKLADNENATSVAVTPSGTQFALGATFSLRLYAADGKPDRAPLWQKYAPYFPYNINITPDEKYVVVCYGDGTVRWHRITDGQEVLALYISEPDHEWVAWTPSGYYDSSPKGEFLIGWHINRGADQSALFYSASRFSDIFRRPDLIQAVLKTGQVPEADPSAALVPRLPPVVHILDVSQDESGKAKVTYKVEVPTGQSVTKLRIRVDGATVEPIGADGRKADLSPQHALLQLTSNDSTIDQTGTKALTLAEAAKTLIVPITAGTGPTQIAMAAESDGRYGDETVRTFNPRRGCLLPEIKTERARPNQGDVEFMSLTAAGHSASSIVGSDPEHRSEQQARPVGEFVQSASSPTCADAPVAGDLYALVIGVSKFNDPTVNSKSPIYYADKDANDVEWTLNQQKNLYAHVVVHKFTNERATREKITEELLWLQDAPQKANDVSLLFLAGHGLRRQQGGTGPQTPDYYFVPYNFDGSLSATGLPYGAIQQYLSGAKGKKLVFLDTCHAGQYGETDPEGMLSALGRDGGVVIWGASGGKNESEELPSLKHGAFTAALLEAFYGYNDAAYRTSTGRLTPSGLTLWLERRVPELTGNRQQPSKLDLTHAPFEFAALTVPPRPH